MSEVKEILNEREKTHGDFKEVAAIYGELKYIMAYDTHGKYNYRQELVIDMICQKLARIKCGDADFIDHWLDIAGYATLVVKELEKLEAENERRENGSK